MEEDVPLVQSVEGPYHPIIERSWKALQQEEGRRTENATRERIGAWRTNRCWEKKGNFVNCNNRDSATDEDVKPALQYMIEMIVDVLRLHFSAGWSLWPQETCPGGAKKKCDSDEVAVTATGRPRQQHMGPSTVDCNGQDCDWDDNEMFITPSATPVEDGTTIYLSLTKREFT